MFSLIGKLAYYATKAVIGSSPPKTPASALGPIWKQLGELWNALLALVGALAWAGRQEKGAWRIAGGSAAGAGADLRQLAADDHDRWYHLLYTILPNSLQYLDGLLMTREIVPLKVRVGRDEGRIGALEGWENATQWWRDNIVDPHIVTVRAFLAYYNGDPRTTVDTWVDWLKHPGKFVSWATPLLTPAAVAYLGDRSQRQLLDLLVGLVLAGSSDLPDQVDQALVAFLNAEAA